MNCLYRCCVIRIIGHLPCTLVGIDQKLTSRLGAAYLVECIHHNVTVYNPIAKNMLISTHPHAPDLGSMWTRGWLCCSRSQQCSADIAEDHPGTLPSFLCLANWHKGVQEQCEDQWW